MRLAEFAGPVWLESYYDASLDVLGKRHLSDTRKGDLTLKDVNRLKKIRAIHKLKDLQRNNLRAIMYGSADIDGLDSESDRLSIQKKRIEVRTKVVDLAAKSRDLVSDSYGCVADAAQSFAISQVRAKKL